MRSIPQSPLDSLAAELQTLLNVAECGNWEQLELLAQSLISRMDELRDTNASSATNQFNKKDISQILSLLNLAIDQCSRRKEQITPLINALVPAKDAPNKA